MLRVLFSGSLVAVSDGNTGPINASWEFLEFQIGK